MNKQINKLINNHKRLYFFIASTIKNFKTSRVVPKISKPERIFKEFSWALKKNLKNTGPGVFFRKYT